MSYNFFKLAPNVGFDNMPVLIYVIKCMYGNTFGVCGFSNSKRALKWPRNYSPNTQRNAETQRRTQERPKERQ